MAKIDKLLIQFKGLCVYCSRSCKFQPDLGPHHPTVDHDVPKTRGGGDGANLVLACKRCNETKDDMTGAEFREFMEMRVLPSSYVAYLTQKTNKKFERLWPDSLRDEVVVEPEPVKPEGFYRVAPAGKVAIIPRTAAMARQSAELSARKTAERSPAVAAILDRFPGAEIISVRAAQ